MTDPAPKPEPSANDRKTEMANFLDLKENLRREEQIRHSIFEIQRYLRQIDIAIKIVLVVVSIIYGLTFLIFSQL